MIEFTDRSNHTLTDSYGNRELRTVNDLIEARRSGRISRRALVQRALQLGIGTSVIGVMLHATSDAAFGAPRESNQLPRRGGAGRETIAVDGPTKPAGEIQDGGTITIGATSDFDSLHPYLSQRLSSFDVLAGIMESLLIYDDKQQLQPLLADSYEISDDGLTYTFKLRDGIKFHNGDAFSAQDVIDSWKMITSQEFDTPVIQGWDKISDITAPDPLTVVIATSEVYAPFLSYIGTTAICPSAELAKGVEYFSQEFGRVPIGTGPMKFTEWVAGKSVTLQKNSDYWGNEPKLDNIVYRILANETTQFIQLQSGGIQMAAGAGAIKARRVDAVLEIEDVDVLEHPSQLWDHLDLKHVDFLRLTKVRQALDFATPTQRIIDQLLRGRAVRAVADQAPGTWAYASDIEPRPYDLEQAKQLLAEAGLTPGEDGVLEGIVPDRDTKNPNATPVADGVRKRFEMELWAVTGDATAQQIVDTIAESWNTIGVQTTTKFGTAAAIWGPQGYQFTDRMTACLFAWQNSNDADDMFYWHSSQIPTSPTGAGGNLPAFFFPYNFQDKIDALTAEAAAELDPKKRKQLYRKIQLLLHEEVPVIFLYWQKTFHGVAQNIGGFWPNAFTSLLWNVQDWYLTK